MIHGIFLKKRVTRPDAQTAEVFCICILLLASTKMMIVRFIFHNMNGTMNEPIKINTPKMNDYFTRDHSRSDRR